jgi:hypothetical protein
VFEKYQSVLQTRIDAQPVRLAFDELLSDLEAADRLVESLKTKKPPEKPVALRET